MDKALRTADQILQAGGFRVVVLDLASVPPDQALVSRRQLGIGSAAPRRKAMHPAFVDSATVCQIKREVRTRLLARLTKNGSIHVFGGMTHAAEVIRQRVANPYIKKAPGRAVAWDSTAPWMRSAGR